MPAHPEPVEGRFIRARGAPVYHDRFYLTERCNTDDIADLEESAERFDPGDLCQHCAAQWALEHSSA